MVRLGLVKLEVQKKLPLRILRPYRTTYSDALLVLAGLIPIDIMAEERCELYLEGQAKNRKAAHKKALAKWQGRCDNNLTKSQWTKRLINT